MDQKAAVAQKPLPRGFFDVEFVYIPEQLAKGNIGFRDVAELACDFALYVLQSRQITAGLPEPAQPGEYCPTCDTWHGTFWQTDHVCEDRPAGPRSYLDHCFSKTHARKIPFVEELKTTVAACLTPLTGSLAAADTRLMELHRKLRNVVASIPKDAGGSGALDTQTPEYKLYLECRALSWAVVFLDPLVLGKLLNNHEMFKASQTMPPSVDAQHNLMHFFAYEAALYLYEFFRPTALEEQEIKTSGAANSSYFIVGHWLDLPLEDRPTRDPKNNSGWFLQTLSSMVYQDSRQRRATEAETTREATYMHFG